MGPRFGKRNCASLGWLKSDRCGIKSRTIARLLTDKLAALKRAYSRNAADVLGARIELPEFGLIL